LKAKKFSRSRLQKHSLSNYKLNPKGWIIGRVISKSRLFHFGKMTDTNDPYPFRFIIEIGKF